jgi:hypothetical protein
LAAPTLAADLAKIDRKLAKEPAYQGQPEYCLLVFGRDASERVWLVIDGDTLYVDRNGNGDLTEEYKKVRASRLPNQQLFEVGTVKPASHEYIELNVTRQRLPDGAAGPQPEHFRRLHSDQTDPVTYSVGVQVENPLILRGKSDSTARITQVASSDSRGLLQFALSPQEAPIIHFDGTWTLDLHHRPELLPGSVMNLEIGVGTKGLGAGTFAFVPFYVVPASVRPRVEFTFVSREAGQGPLHAGFDVLERC